jgi:hypothetical protein
MLKNIIDKIQVKYLTWQSEKTYQYIEKRYEFIWGIKSCDDLTSQEANLHTMNDIDVIYDKERNKYNISIETIYQFSNSKDGEKQYIQSLLDKFTEWMNEKKYNTNVHLYLHEVFTYNIQDGFDSIEDLYTYFKLLVAGFISK